MRRTANIYGAQKRRAAKAGAGLDYTLSDLRLWCRIAVIDTRCYYCDGAVTEANLSADHAMPVGRGGSWDRENIRICCKRCNRAKGALCALEYRQLLDLAGTWPDVARESILRRLQAGAAIVRC